jgi:hypothetical protein
MTQLDTDTARIVSALAEINARIADLNEQAEGLKAELRGLGQGEYDIDGRVALRIIPSRRFDATAGAGLLDEETRKMCLAVSYDATKVKQHLTEIQIDACMNEFGKPKVVLS